MSQTQILEYKKIIGAPKKQVYQAFSSSVALETWFADFAEVILSKDGRFYVFWNAGHDAVGQIKEVSENKVLIFSWRGRGESHETEVKIRFEDSKGQTQVSLVHSGLGTTGHWEHSVKAIGAGWEYALDNLKTVMETGVDKRINDRPMLGIYPNQEIDDEMAEKLGLPVNTGIQIGGVVDNLGAEAAGLQANDILFSFNDHELKSFTDFATAMAGKKAGDVVNVTFYRDGEKQQVDMTLSQRPNPDIPETAKALADQVSQSYDEIDSEIEAVFEGVADKVASIRPEPEEWSAKETLVHLLYTERWLHLAISCAVTEQRTGGFANQLELIKAMADCYTLRELLDELKLSEKITVKSLAALPDDFIADKRKFSGYVSSFGQGFAQHSRSHIDQIKAAIQSARSS